MQDHPNYKYRPRRRKNSKRTTKTTNTGGGGRNGTPTDEAISVYPNAGNTLSGGPNGVHEMAADNSSISSPSLDYCGVQTPESSPHGSPLAEMRGNGNGSSNNNNTSAADLYRYSSSPRAFYNQNYATPTNTTTVGSPGIEMTSVGSNNNGNSKKNNGSSSSSSSLRDTIKSLPTPEMSPVEANEKAAAAAAAAAAASGQNDPALSQQYYGQLLHKQQQQHHNGLAESMHSQMYNAAAMAFQQQQQYSSQYKIKSEHQDEQLLLGSSPPNSSSNNSQSLKSPQENPFSELVNRFSGSSTFLRNVCPPYAYRMQSRESIEEMQRSANAAASAAYLMGGQTGKQQGQMDQQHQQQQFDGSASSRSMLQQHLELPMTPDSSFTD
ncbi:PREDICTED: putative uncharacterized protein DDB_G0277255 [Rhagoletis zephyria]|uniref:putative uncharacterized protein DDB_G0277255 n=1 Tax=Rhagoletis zephyria TaxID=28612 RepID=UPI00081136A8|nr:PREDICTED: putative uncharacterized protein DDB_G0277255 [Rhagoletis zephyria]